MMTAITAHFSWDEVTRSASHPELVEPPPDELRGSIELLARSVLEPIRLAVGEPMTVLSWYRSPALNAAVGGSPTSQHVLGEACDFRCKHLRTAWLKIVSLVQSDALLGAGQMIYYPNRGFIHVALSGKRFRQPTLCVHWPERGLRYARHSPTASSFASMVPARLDPQRALA